MELIPQAPSFQWIVEPAAQQWDGRRLVIDAGPLTDNFIDPAGAAPVHNAPMLLAPLPAHPVAFSALATTVADAMFAAATLYVYVAPDTWAKLALELSPQGELTVVSVITRGDSDDANHHPVDAAPTHLRISSLGNDAYAFHASADAEVWAMVRYFSLPSAGRPIMIGLSSQSPTGQSCRSIFEQFSWSSEVPVNLRDGS